MPYFLKEYYPVRKVLFSLGEGFLIFTTILLVYLFFSGIKIFSLELIPNTIRALSVTTIFLLYLYFFDLYNLKRPDSILETIFRLVQAFSVGCIALAGLYYSFPVLVISTKVFWVCYAIICLILTAWRTLYFIILERDFFSHRIAIIGGGETAKNITNELLNNLDAGYTLTALVDYTNRLEPLDNIKVFPNLSALAQQPIFDTIDHIVVALEDRRGTMPVEELLDARINGVKIEDGITFYEAITGKILVKGVNPGWLIFSDGFEHCRSTYYIKRFLDITLSLTGLLFSLPVTLITALLIKLESPGPIFYLQERVGERGAPFSLIKFRSMRQDAEKNGAVWALKNDSRVTKIGAFIRKIRIDEIPQMWNVLKGEMSFVGPRPERPVFVEKLTENIPYYSLRHSVKPGITGWAQVCYPYGASEEDALKKLEFDLYYIKNQSIYMDLLIVFRTIKTVLLQQGSR